MLQQVTMEVVTRVSGLPGSPRQPKRHTRRKERQQADPDRFSIVTANLNRAV